MPVTRAMEQQLSKILEAIADVKDSTNTAIADVKDSTNAAITDVNAAIAESKESTNAAIAESKESTNAAIAEIKESTMAEIAKVSAKVEESVSEMRESVSQVKESTTAEIAKVSAKVESTAAAIRIMEERLHKLEVKEGDGNTAVGFLPNMPSIPDSVFVPPTTTPMPSVKASMYDGKTAWNVYKTQFDMVAAANGWNDVMKAYHLAASLRGEAADVLLTVPESRRADLAALTTALELRFGDHHLKDYTRAQLKSRRQKPGESLQELASEIERLSLVAFPECPADVRDTLALEYFVDAIREPDVQTRVRLSDCKDLKSALVFAMKIEAAHLASGRDRRPVRTVAAQDTTELLEKRFLEIERLLKSRDPDRRKTKEARLSCWSCKKGHLRRNCPERKRTFT